MSKYVLTISILCSRNLTQVKKCIESVVPAMEQMEVELLLTDTVGDVELRNLLQSYPARILSYSWNRDFAEARNLGLKEARGDWFMYLDDDEWVDDLTPLVDFFQSGEYKRYEMANYIQRNYQEEDGSRFVDLWVNRMIHRREEVCFKGRIHEYLTPDTGNCKGLPLVVNHTGYLFSDEKRRRAHFDRNASLLVEMIQEEPDNFRWRTQLIQEYYSVGDTEAIIKEGNEALKLADNPLNKVMATVLDTFYVAVAEAHIRRREYEAARQKISEAMEDARISSLCRARLWLLLAECRYAQQCYEEVKACVTEYLKQRDSLIVQGIAYENMRLALFLGDTFDETNEKRAYSLLMMAGIKQGDKEPLCRYFDRLQWKGRVLYVHEGFPEVLLEAVQEYPFEEGIQECAIVMYANPVLREYILSLGNIEKYPVFRWLIVNNPLSEGEDTCTERLAGDFCRLHRLVSSISEQIQILKENDRHPEAEQIEGQIKKLAPWY